MKQTWSTKKVEKQTFEISILVKNIFQKQMRACTRGEVNFFLITTKICEKINFLKFRFRWKYGKKHFLWERVLAQVKVIFFLVTSKRSAKETSSNWSESDFKYKSPKNKRKKWQVTIGNVDSDTEEKKFSKKCMLPT